MDQLGVVTSVLVLSTLLMSLEDVRKFWRRKFGKAPEPAGTAASEQMTGAEAVGQTDLVSAVMADLESDDERRIQRALSMADKLPLEKAAPPLIQMLRHPKDEVGARAAQALLLMNHPSILEPLYLYYNARGARA
ncbi:MAG: hypothetical protein HY814_14685 [Candidatus Riflebacteria bacterium]|nr:hypothetical protein [Candidatus Riflebacteria bacterium]